MIETNHIPAAAGVMSSDCDCDMLYIVKKKGYLYVKHLRLRSIAGFHCNSKSSRQLEA